MSWIIVDFLVPVMTLAVGYWVLVSRGAKPIRTIKKTKHIKRISKSENVFRVYVVRTYGTEGVLVQESIWLIRVVVQANYCW